MEQVTTEKMAVAAAGGLLVAAGMAVKCCGVGGAGYGGKRKQIAIIGGGTRGDVEPLISLAVGLMRIGFNPVVWCGDEGRDRFTKLGIVPHPMRHNTPLHHPHQRDRSDVNAALEGGPSSVLKFKQKLLVAEYKKILTTLRGNCDMVVSSLPGLPVLASLCGELKVPGLVLILQPWKLSRNVPEVFSATEVVQFGAATAAAVNTLCGSSVTFTATDFNKIINCEHQTIRSLYAFPYEILSPHPPSDYSQLFLTRHIGYVRLPDTLATQGAHNSDIIKFIDSDDGKVAFFCLGSMTLNGGDNKRTVTFVAQAMRAAGLRGVIQSGWASFGPSDVIGTDLSEWAATNIYFTTKEVTHTLIFPLCCLVIHHGGAGTTGSCLLSGTPSIVSPISFDQEWHATTVIRLACGYRIPSFNSSAQILPPLTAAISKCLDPDQVRRCHQVADVITKRQGLRTTLEHIVSLIINNTLS